MCHPHSQVGKGAPDCRASELQSLCLSWLLYSGALPYRLPGWVEEVGRVG